MILKNPFSLRLLKKVQMSRNFAGRRAKGQARLIPLVVSLCKLDAELKTLLDAPAWTPFVQQV